MVVEMPQIALLTTLRERVKSDVGLDLLGAAAVPR